MLTLVMALALAMVVSATSATYSITISNAAVGETYTAYKVFDATYVTVTETEVGGGTEAETTYVSYTIDSDSEWYSLMSAQTSLFTLEAAAYQGVSGVTTYVVTQTGSDADVLSWFNSLTATDLSNAGITTSAASGSISASGDTLTLDVTSSGAGYYYITTTLGSLVTLDTITTTATVEDKNGVPTIDKEVSNTEGSGYDSTNTASIGDTVYFRSTIRNFAGTSNLELLVDKMDEGLTLDASSITIIYYVDDTDTGTDITSSLNGYIDTNNTSYTFTVDFESLMSTTLSSATADSYIVITYSATVDGSGTTVEYNNETYVTYGGSSSSTKSTTTTYVSKFTLNKVNSSQTTISGAVFYLYDSDNNLLYFTKSGDVYTLASSTASGATAEIEAGNVTIFGLDVGTYTLTETTAPDGYNKLTSSVTIVISATYDSNGKINGTTMSYEYETESETDQTEIDVVNNTGSEMPSTGGIGTTIFYVVGAVLVLLAIVLLITRWMVGRREQQ
ncbi:MAG: LPXTG cell wall anchor domain-containing protein [Lachnospiraceae bacterium]|nr:LPXTG cell wall anchor domain-containing protein [Lachnospiraceae bacterium]